LEGFQITLEVESKLERWDKELPKPVLDKCLWKNYALGVRKSFLCDSPKLTVCTKQLFSLQEIPKVRQGAHSN
jgi:hypothetical protein